MGGCHIIPRRFFKLFFKFVFVKNTPIPSKSSFLFSLSTFKYIKLRKLAEMIISDIDVVKFTPDENEDRSLTYMLSIKVRVFGGYPTWLQYERSETMRGKFIIKVIYFLLSPYWIRSTLKLPVRMQVFLDFVIKCRAFRKNV